MDINESALVEISGDARLKIINDFFPSFLECEFLPDYIDLDSKTTALHAGALCLYAASLITKVYENNQVALNPDCEARKESLYSLIENHPKFSSLTDEEISAKVDEIISKDIRNCFAHGNFKIKCDEFTKKLYFVLYPTRKDFVTPEPIVISKQSLLNANRQAVAEIANKAMFSPSLQRSMVNSKNLGQTLKNFLLPTEMLKLSEHYLENKKSNKNYTIDEKRYFYIHNALLISKMAYEQDQYYKIFGKDSDIFNKISLIRNSIAHDNFEFSDLGRSVSYVDRTRTLNKTPEDSVALLLDATDKKDLILSVSQGDYSQESINSLTDELKKCFTLLFNESSTSDSIADNPSSNDNKSK